MTEPKTVYGVSQGEYSDYFVVAIYESKDDAQAYVTAMNGDKGASSYGAHRVEEFPMYAAGQGPKVYTTWRAGWPKVGLSTQVMEGDPIWTRQEQTEEEPPTRPRVQEGPTYINAVCVDRDAAIKAVKDRVAARLAFPPTESSGPDA